MSRRFMLYYPCIENRQGQILVKVGSLRDWSRAVDFLKAKYPDAYECGRAVPQPEHHPGLVESLV